MHIRQLRFQDRVFQFRDGPYVMSYATQSELGVRILELETEDGGRGWGEIVRKPNLDGQAVARLEEPLIRSLEGLATDALSALLAVWRRDLQLRGLAYGVETAWLDLLARRCDEPMYNLLGGRLCRSLPQYYSVSSEAPRKMAQKLRLVVDDWPVVQIKLGIDDRQTDRVRIRDALSILGPGQTILADFNGELDVDAALALISEFDDHRLIWEEPCRSVAQNIEVARLGGKPVMFDQCLQTLEDYSTVIASGVAHSVCIKPPFLGGLGIARAARDLCIDAGLPMRIDGPWSGHVANAANLQLALGAPQSLLIAGCDLRQPLIIDDDWGGVEHLPDRRIGSPGLPGHGVEPPLGFDQGA